MYCLVKVKKKLQKPCTNNLAQRRIQKDCDQSKYLKLKTLQSRRLFQGLIKQCEIRVELRYFDWPMPVFIGNERRLLPDTYGVKVFL